MRQTFRTGLRTGLAGALALFGAAPRKVSLDQSDPGPAGVHSLGGLDSLVGKECGRP